MLKLYMIDLLQKFYVYHYNFFDNTCEIKNKYTNLYEHKDSNIIFENLEDEFVLILKTMIKLKKDPNIIDVFTIASAQVLNNMLEPRTYVVAECKDVETALLVKLTYA